MSRISSVLFFGFITISFVVLLVSSKSGLYVDQNGSQLSQMLDVVFEESSSYNFSCDSSSSDNCKPSSHDSSASMQCHYIKQCCKNTVSGGLINYLTLVYCNLSSEFDVTLL